jgi:LysM repeat protein
MRWRVLAFILLGVNLALALALLRSPRTGSRGQTVEELASGSSGLGKTNVVLRRQYFTWREIESDDYPTYVANLRDINCPEQTIRDIIIADVNALYSRRRALEVVTSDQQWWRAEPDSNVVAVAEEKSRVLDDERRALLGRLLGTNWESGDLVNLPRPSRPGIALDGEVLGSLPIEIKQSLEEINIRSVDNLRTYIEAQRREGKTPDPAELAKIRQQTRAELQRVLNPAQLEEYLLRYSENAMDLRTELGQLRYFNASSNEFRGIFRSTDLLNQQIQLLASATDPNSVAQRKSLEDQRDKAIQLALGPARYDEYRMLHDPLYRNAVASAEQAGAPESAATIYQINLASAAEVERIRTDPNLTQEQKTIELKRLEVEQLEARALAAGQDLPPTPPDMKTAPPKKTYVVRPGDSASVVSMIYGVPVNALRAANPGTDISRLRPGDSLNIPTANLPPPPPR